MFYRFAVTIDEWLFRTPLELLAAVLKLLGA
jgi:hypothetical protein